MKHIEITHIEGGFLVRYDKPSAFSLPFDYTGGIRQVVLTDLTEVERLVHWLYCEREECEWCEERSTPECEIIHEARAAVEPKGRSQVFPWPTGSAVPPATLGTVLSGKQLAALLGMGQGEAEDEDEDDKGGILIF